MIPNSKFQSGFDELLMKKIFVILPYCPNKVRIRTLRILEDLASFSNVDLFVLDDGADIFLPPNVNLVARINNCSKISRYFRLFFGLLNLKPLSYQFYNKRGLDVVLGRFDLNSYDAVYIERLPFFEYGIKNKNIIFDNVDCFSDQVKQFSQSRFGVKSLLYKIDSFIIGSYERRLCNCANRVLVTTALEADKLKSLGVKPDVFPLLHALQIYPICEEIVVAHKFSKILSFHGKLSYLPNAMAIGLIENSIMPKLANDIRFQVVGSTSGVDLANFKRLIFRGFVDNLREALEDVDLSVFPIVSAVGVQNKVLESLALGVPVLVTPVVFKALPFADSILEKGIFVADVDCFDVAIEKFYSLSVEVIAAYKRESIRYINTLINDESRRQRLSEIIWGGV